jgi:hypothetical protein
LTWLGELHSIAHLMDRVIRESLQRSIARMISRTVLIIEVTISKHVAKRQLPLSEYEAETLVDEFVTERLLPGEPALSHTCFFVSRGFLAKMKRFRIFGAKNVISIAATTGTTTFRYGSIRRCT